MMKVLKLFVLILASICILIGVFVLVNGIVERDLNKGEISEKLNSVLFDKSILIKNFIEAQEDKFYSVYDEKLFVDFLKMSENDVNYNTTRDILYERFDINRGTVMGLINSEGIFVIDTEGILEGFDIKEYPEGVRYLQEGDGEIAYMILPHPFLDEYYLLTPKKLYDEFGNFVGIFSYRVPDDDLRDFLSVVHDFDGFGEGYLIDENLFLLTPSKFLRNNNTGILLQVVNTTNSIKCMEKLDFHYDDRNGMYMGEINEYVTYRGEEVFGVYALIKKPRWCLLVEVSKDEIYDRSIVEFFSENIFSFLD